MKQLLSSLPLVLASSAALANATGDIIVKGTVTTPSCVVAADNGGNFDLGKISAQQLTADVVRTTLTVSCDADTYLLFSAQDNRADSVTENGTDYFGLGMHDIEKIGAYQVKIDNATVDGVSKSLAFDDDDAYTFSVKDSQWLDTDPTSFIGWADGSNTLSVGQSFAADLSVYSTFAIPENRAEARSLDGSFTMNFRFGI